MMHIRIQNFLFVYGYMCVQVMYSIFIMMATVNVALHWQSLTPLGCLFPLYN